MAVDGVSRLSKRSVKIALSSNMSAKLLLTKKLRNVECSMVNEFCKFNLSVQDIGNVKIGF